MTKFIMGLLLGLILGIGGTAAFLISAQGGDFLVVTSPRVRELEASLKQADQERTWLREQIKNSADVVTKLESRFLSLATRFENLGAHAANLLKSTATPPTATAAPAKQQPLPPASKATGAKPATTQPTAAPAGRAQATPGLPEEASKPAKAPPQAKKKTAGGSATRPTPAGKI